MRVFSLLALAPSPSLPGSGTVAGVSVMSATAFAAVGAVPGTVVVLLPLTFRDKLADATPLRLALPNQ